MSKRSVLIVLMVGSLFKYRYKLVGASYIYQIIFVFFLSFTIKITTTMKKLFSLILFVFAGLMSYAQHESGFNFVESSTGMGYPQWESGMTELEFADIDMDGYVDILSIGDHGSPNINATEHGIMVWFGDGTGSWSVEMTGNFGYGGIAIGDVNNDGHWDVGYGMHHDYSSTDLGDQLLEVALGDGTGTNWTAWDDGLATNGEDWGLFGTDFADVDNDGDLDIGSNSFGSGSGLHVYINQGDGSWQQSFGILPGNSNMRFVFGDINRDGNADFVVTHDAGIAFFGDGEGNFSNADYNLPDYSFPVFGADLGDVDGDGGQDLAYAELSGGIRVWTFNEDNNQWEDVSGSLPASGDFQEVQLCDFNRDGTMDIAAFGNANLTIWKGIKSAEGPITWLEMFNTTTSDNGDCAAFRAGGDVDRNGYPDITLVEKEGSWPNDQNHLKCFKETTPLFLNHIKAVFPLGNEVFRQGSVQFADWLSGVPAASSSQVKVQLSLRGKLGPFTTLTTATANSGRYQWTVPNTISTNNCFMKYTLIEGDDTLTSITPNAFTILGDDGIEAGFTADSSVVLVGSFVQFTDQSLGLLESWEWDFDNDGSVDATDRNPMHAYEEAGIYTVSLTVSDGSNSETVTKTDYIEVYDGVDVMEYQSQEIEFSLMPNPVGDHCLIQLKSSLFARGDIIDVVLTDLNGNEVMNFRHLCNSDPYQNIRLKLDRLPSGIYLCTVRADGRAAAKKLVKY